MEPVKAMIPCLRSGANLTTSPWAAFLPARDQRQRTRFHLNHAGSLIDLPAGFVSYGTTAGSVAMSKSLDVRESSQGNSGNN
jgi:hypothetical protein